MVEQTEQMHRKRIMLQQKIVFRILIDPLQNNMSTNQILVKEKQQCTFCCFRVTKILLADVFLLLWWWGSIIIQKQFCVGI